MKFQLKKPTRRFETVPLAKVPHKHGEDPAVQKLVEKQEPYAVPVLSDVEVRSLKRKPGH
jgi:hypothetical protein